MFADFEDAFDCSGVCWTPLFGISRNIADGPPDVECVGALIDTLDSLMGPAIICLITAFIMMCACCASIPLCTGYNPDEDEAEDKEGGVEDEEQE